jgi:4-hydroxybutyrate---CoA ligase (AMP-forming)
MALADFYRDVMDINTMSDMYKRESDSKSFFNRLNKCELPDFFNWASEVFEGIHVRERGGQIALIWDDLDTGYEKKYTYREVSEESNKFLNLIRKYGVTHKDNLYQMIPILPETWFTSIAGIKGGTVIVPTATNITVRELEYRFGTHNPDVVVADENSVATMDEAIRITGSNPKVKIVIGKADGWISYGTVEDEFSHSDPAEVRKNDIQFCYFTSGTTGLPKRVGHSAVSYPVGHLSTAVMIGLEPGKVHHNISAPGWGKWAWSSFFAPFNVGAIATAITFKNFNSDKYLSLIEKHKINTLCAPPTAWRMFIHSDLTNFDFSSLEQSISAGEPLNPEIIHQWKKHTGIEIRELYGQTESTAMIGNPPWLEGKMKYGSFGYPSYMYDIKLVDDVKGEVINEPHITGHIAVNVKNSRPVGLFEEYIGNPERMSEVFINGFYHTGDKAYFDDDGYWWFVGRSDDVIKSSDFRIGPFEVESALMEHDSIIETAIIGVPDPERYQLVKAFVILKKGSEPSKELALELFKHTIGILTKFKIPRIIEFVDSLPKTTSGKIIRMKLRNDEAKDLHKDNTKQHVYFYKDFPELSSKNICK